MSHLRSEHSASLEKVFVQVTAAMNEGAFSAESTARLSDLMRHFVTFARTGFAVEDAEDVTPAIADGFVRARARDGSLPAVATMHLRRATVRLLFAEGRRLGLATHDPTMDLRLPPRSSLRTRALSDEEVALCRSFSMHTSSETRQPAAWAFAEATARSAEIARVRVQDLDLERSRVWIAGGSKTEARWGELSPWGLARVDHRLRSLRRPRPDERLVCPQTREGAVATSSASVAIASTLRRAGLHCEPDVRPASVAAWVGAKALSEGTRIDEVARMLGVRSLDRAAAFIGYDWTRVEFPDAPEGPP